MIVDSFLCIANQHLPGFEKISVPEGTKVNSRAAQTSEGAFKNLLKLVI